jgi:ABC-2 type transport system permease protein
MFLNRLREIYQFRDLIYSFVSRDLKVRYRGSVLGFLWSFLDPLLNMLILWLVFGIIFSRGGEDFPIFLLIGILPWSFFSSSVNQGSRIIKDNGGLIKKIYLPREVFPLATVLANLIHFLLALVVLGGVLVLFGTDINFGGLLFFPLILLLSILFNYGTALFSSAVSVYFRDFPFIIDSLLRVGYFATPIFYSVSMIPEDLRGVYLLNPLASAVTAYRQILLEGKFPDTSLLVSLAVVSVVVLSLSWLVFSKLQKGFAEEV